MRNAELRRSAVTSRTIKNQAIEIQDLSLWLQGHSLSASQGRLARKARPLSRFARRSLPSDTQRRAILTGFVANCRTSALSASALRSYGCVPTATLARNSGDPGLGHVIVSLEENNTLVSVETYNAAGAPDFLPFNVVVAC